MGKKKMMNEYQIKYRVNAIVGVYIKAESFEKAKNKADKRMNKLFDPGIEYLDGTEEFAGFDNMDYWNV